MMHLTTMQNDQAEKQLIGMTVYLIYQVICVVIAWNSET